jgi:hypothetical protein
MKHLKNFNENISEMKPTKYEIEFLLEFTNKLPFTIDESIIEWHLDTCATWDVSELEGYEKEQYDTINKYLGWTFDGDITWSNIVFYKDNIKYKIKTLKNNGSGLRVGTIE